MELSEIINEILARGIWFNIGHWFVIVATLTLGILAYKRNPRNLNNRSFVFLNLSFSVWTLSMFIADFTFLPHNLVLTLNRSTFTFGFLIAFAYFRFCLIFPDQNKTRPWYYLAAILISLTFGLLALTTGLVQKDFFLANNNSFNIKAINSFLFGPVVLAYALMAFGGSLILFFKLKKLKGTKRAQLQYVLTGVFSFIIFVFTTNLIPQLLKLPDLARYSALGIIFFIAFTDYAIIKHRLMDIRLVVLKSAVYTTLIALLASTYIALIFYLKKYYEKIINPDAVFIAASIIIVFGFQPLRRFLQKYADRIFAKGQYNFEELLSKISNILSTNLVLDNLSEQLLLTLTNAMKIRKSAFVMANGYYKNYGIATLPRSSRRPVQGILDLAGKRNDSDALFKIAQFNQTVVADELEDDSPTKKLMQKLGIEVLVFFPDSENKLLGFLALSEKASGDAYTARDLKLLEIIAPQISIALKNIEQQQQMIENIVEERQRINQDAHDHIYNRLGALSKKAEVALLNPEEAESTLKLLKDDLRSSVEDLQNIVSGKTEQASDKSIAGEELEKLCQDFINKCGIKLIYNFDDSLVTKIKPQHYWHLQCILEECLNNVRKHSKATEVKVSLEADDGIVSMQVIDNGVGIKTKQNELGGHLGLKGMQERAKKLNAKINISSNNGKGTKVELRIPSTC